MKRSRRNPIRRFGRDQEGSVMVITIIMMLMLIKVALSTYNVGVLSAERIRLQIVADSAAYSAATWQARFLNYCAYSRRAMIANMANIELLTAVESNKKSIIEYKDSEFDAPLGDDVPGLPYLSGQALGAIYPFLWDYAESYARESADHLNYLLSESQDVLYLYTSNPWVTVVPEIAENANVPTSDGRTSAQIEVPIAYQLWGFSGSYNLGYLDGNITAPTTGRLCDGMIEKKSISYFEKDMEERRDPFTLADPGQGFDWLPDAFGDVIDVIGGLPGIPNSIPFLASRDYWGIDFTIAIEVFGCYSPNARWFYIIVDSEEVDADYGQNQVSIETTDEAFPFVQIYNWGFKPIPIPPLGWPCIPWLTPWYYSNTWNGNYDLKYNAPDVSSFIMKEGLEASEMEPSVYVALKIDRDELVKEDGTGRLFHHSLMPLGASVADVYAVSRGKVYFQPREEYSKGDFYQPNLYHPYWEAKLAPFWGSGKDSQYTSDTINDNAESLLKALTLEQSLDSGADPATVGFWQDFFMSETEDIHY